MRPLQRIYPLELSASNHLIEDQQGTDIAAQIPGPTAADVLEEGKKSLCGLWKQWIDEHRTTRKTGSGRRKVTSGRDDQHLLCMAVNDRTASSRQLAYCYRCTNVGFVNSSTSAAPWIACKVPLYGIPLTANHRWLRLQWAHEQRALLTPENRAHPKAIGVSSRPKLTGIVRGKAFLHVLRRRPIGCPDSRKRTL
ncbi:uncharacterized protein TNCV_609321 [Trichonephila clavipes]|nr:uncharacterized protein TNCV_609321 [Trichonephila clavipes]